MTEKSVFVGQNGNFLQNMGNISHKIAQIFVI
jgi:hypothetical protein